MGISTPLHEHALSPLEEPGHVSFLSPVPTVGAVGQETFHHYQDALPSSVTVETFSEDVQGSAEDCPSTVDDNDSWVLGTSLELFTPPEASEPTLANSASAPTWTAYMAADNTSIQNEDVQTHTPRDCSFSNFSLHTNSIIASLSSGVSTIHDNAPSGDTKAFHFPVQTTCVSPETARPSRTELASSNSTSTADRVPGLIHPQAEAIRGPDHLGLRPFDRPMPPVSDSAEPASDLSTRRSSSDSSLSQAEHQGNSTRFSLRECLFLFFSSLFGLMLRSYGSFSYLRTLLLIQQNFNVFSLFSFSLMLISPFFLLFFFSHAYIAVLYVLEIFAALLQYGLYSLK